MYYPLEPSFTRVLQFFTLHPLQHNLPIVEPDNVLHPGEWYSFNCVLQSYKLHPPQLKLPIVERDYVLDPESQLHSRATKLYTAPSPAHMPIVEPDHGGESSFISVLQSYILHPPQLNFPTVEPDHVLHPGAQLHSRATNFTLHPLQHDMPIVEPDNVLHPGEGAALIAYYKVYCTLPSSNYLLWKKTMC